VIQEKLFGVFSIDPPNKALTTTVSHYVPGYARQLGWVKLNRPNDAQKKHRKTTLSYYKKPYGLSKTNNAFESQLGNPRRFNRAFLLHIGILHGTQVDGGQNARMRSLDFTGLHGRHQR